MSVTLVYDDGEQSRHPRYRIPATVEIDGWRYPVQEWSLDGFAVAGVHEAEALEGSFPARLWFRLDGFSVVVEVNGQVARHDGWFAAHRTHLLLDADRGIGVVVLANSDNASARQLADDLYRFVLTTTD